MKNFDVESTRPKEGSFKIGEYVFTHRAGVPAEVIGKVLDTDRTSTMEEIAGWDEFVLAALVSADHERWKEARRFDAEPPIGLGDLRNVGWFLVEVMMGRPTGSLSGSGGTPTSTGTPSTEISPSAEVASQG